MADEWILNKIQPKKEWSKRPLKNWREKCCRHPKSRGKEMLWREMAAYFDKSEDSVRMITAIPNS